MFRQYECEIEELKIGVYDEAFSGVFCVCGGFRWNTSFSTQTTSHPISSRAAECNGTESFLGAGE